MMNSPHCEKEEKVFSALRTGALDASLLDHARRCAACSDVLLVATRMGEEAAPPDDTLDSLPDPGLIWRRAQTNAREKALARAAMPIRVMRACAAVLAIFASPWLVFQLLHPPAWIFALGFGRPLAIEGGWATALTGTILLGATLACIAAGSWYMLREK